MNVYVRRGLDQEMLEKLLHLSFLCGILLCGRPKQKASEDRACKEREMYQSDCQLCDVFQAWKALETP